MDNSDFLKALYQKAHALRAPIFASIELSKRCNLHCRHCYLQELAGIEIDTSGWVTILQSLEKAGCLHLLLTGGEPLIRADFDTIYTEACRLGLLVSVFTNATLITSSVIRLFERYPPYEIEITILGAQPATHDAITGMPGSFTATIQAIQKMQRHGHMVNLKTIVMHPNWNQLHLMREMAHQLGCGFRFDTAVFSRLNGDSTPQKLRITTRQSLDLDLEDQPRVESWLNRCTLGLPPSSDSSLYACAAGVTKCHISADGKLYPCILSTHSLGDLTVVSFDELWNHNARIWRQKAVKIRPSPCIGCPARLYCPACPAINKLECGDERIPPDFFCTIGKLRASSIENLLQKSIGQGHDHPEKETRIQEILA